MENKTYSKKTDLTLIGLSAAIMGLLFLAIGSLANQHTDHVGIYTLSIEAATGNLENTNCVGLVENWGSAYAKSNREQLTSADAMQLIEEVKALPDVLGDETDPFAYKIRLQYYDENKERVLTEKYGYGAFPENWSRIVGCHNKINEREQLTYSTDIVMVDAELLRDEFGVTQEMFPADVTVEKYLEDTGLTYPDLYGRTFHPDQHIHSYLYDYYDLASHRITAGTAATASDAEALKEYAQTHLERVDAVNEDCVEGAFAGYEFQIVRFDRFTDWKAATGVDGEDIAPDGTIDIYYDIHVGPEGMSYRETHYVYADPTSRFLIITTCDDYEVIHSYFE